MAARHSHEGVEEGVELDSSDHSNEGSVEGESLLGSCEDAAEVEDEHCDRSDNYDTNRRTVLHTYSVFISNIGAEEEGRVSMSTNQLSIPESDSGNTRTMESNHTIEDGQCHVDVNDVAQVAVDGDILIEDQVSDDRGSVDSEEAVKDGEGGDGGEAGFSGEVKKSWRKKIASGVRVALLDLKLFLW